MVQSYFNIKETELDLYKLISHKSERFSWGMFGEVEKYIDKKETIQWMSRLRDYSNDTVNTVMVQGLFENGFNQITFVLRLSRSDDFRGMNSKDVYKVLHDFVSSTPDGIVEFLDPTKFNMSVEMMALLSRDDM